MKRLVDHVGIGDIGTGTPSGTLQIAPQNADDVALVIMGSQKATQTADLLQIAKSDGTIVLCADCNGKIWASSWDWTSTSSDWVTVTCTTLTATNITAANIVGTTMSGTTWTPTTLRATNLSGTTIHGTTLTATNITAANIVGTTMSGTTWIATNLTGTNIHGTTLTATNITAANIVGTLTSGTSIIATNLTGTNIHGTTLTATNITAANIVGAAISGTTIIGTTTRATNLSGTTTHCATLTATNITAANIVGATISGTTVIAQGIQLTAQLSSNSTELYTKTVGTRVTTSLRTVGACGTVDATVTSATYISCPASSVVYVEGFVTAFCTAGAEIGSGGAYRIQAMVASAGRAVTSTVTPLTAAAYSSLTWIPAIAPGVADGTGVMAALTFVGSAGNSITWGYDVTCVMITSG